MLCLLLLLYFFAPLHSLWSNSYIFFYLDISFLLACVFCFFSRYVGNIFEFFFTNNIFRSYPFSYFVYVYVCFCAMKMAQFIFRLFCNRFFFSCVCLPVPPTLPIFIFALFTYSPNRCIYTQQIRYYSVMCYYCAFVYSDSSLYINAVTFPK